MMTDDNDVPSFNLTSARLDREESIMGFPCSIAMIGVLRLWLQSVDLRSFFCITISLVFPNACFMSESLPARAYVGLGLPLQTCTYTYFLDIPVIRNILEFEKLKFYGSFKMVQG